MRKSNGFTLVELVITMILLGMSAVFTLSFIGDGTRFFIDSVNRSEVSNYAKNLIFRMKRQIESAIPYSIEVQTNNGNTYLQFIEPKAFSRIIEVYYLNNKILLSTNEEAVLNNVSDDCKSNKKLILLQGRELKAFDYSINGHNITLINADLKKVFEKYSSNASRVYFTDGCSFKRYYGLNDKLYYQSGFLDNNYKAVKTSELNGNDIQVSGIIFNLSFNGNAVTPIQVKNSNSVVVGMLITDHGQSVSLSHYMEVLNAP